MFRSTLTCTIVALAIATLSLSAPLSAALSAKAPSPAAATDSSAVAPSAVAALNTMATYLRTLKAFRVQSATTTDDVLDNGEVIQSAATVNYVVRMPNKLVADVVSNTRERRFIYDGQTFTVWARRPGYYASVAAPPTLRELDDMLSDKFNIELPLVDLFRFGSPNWTAPHLTSATDVGPSTIGDTTCEQYAFRQEGADWQIWIQQGDYPLPRQLVITTTSEEARPRFTAVYTWDLAPSFDDQAFVFEPPANAEKIVLVPDDDQ